jgi:hypothetical protein
MKTLKEGLAMSPEEIRTQNEKLYAPEVSDDAKLAFLTEIEAVCRKHNLSLTWSCMGGFEVGKLAEEDVEILLDSPSFRRWLG